MARPYHRIMVVALFALGLSACAGMELQKVRGMSAGGSAFDQALFKEYIALSQSEFSEGDYTDSDYFARKAADAAAGRTPAPQAIDQRSLPSDAVAPLTAARSRLVAALGGGAATATAAPAARAQAMFDCWMQEQEENFQSDDIAMCKGEFDKAMAALEVKPAAPAAAAPAPKPAAMPAAVMIPFDFDSAALNAEARITIGTVVASAKKASTAKVMVTGHADRAGDVNYNQALSKKRVDRVVREITEMGVDAKRISANAVGETKPKVPTADGQREAGNRIVEVVFQP